MNTWLELINDIKRRFSSEYLTPAQKLAYGALLRHMRVPNWVNLHGPNGSGKTTMAWILARATGANYVPTMNRLQELQPNHEALIIDNSPYREMEVRNVLATCGLLNCYTVVLITTQSITMPIFKVELSLPNWEEIEMIEKTLTRLGYICNKSKLPENPSFWDVIGGCV